MTPTDPPAGLAAEDEALLAALPLFAGVTAESRRALLAHAAVHCRKRHTVLFLQGEPARHFYVVLDGWARLFRTSADGQETTVAAFARGDSFAEAASFAEGTYPVSADIAADARLLVVPAAPFVGQLRRTPQLAVNMLASMSRHLRGLVQELEQRAVKSAAQRLGAFLLQRCPPEARRAEIGFPADKAPVAARLGMRPETLSRALAALRPVGVSVCGRRVTVSDVGSLRRYAEDGRPPGARFS